jgi:hypothetical protein
MSLSTAAIAQSASESAHCPQSKVEQGSTFGPNNPEWQAEFAGINLSSEQTNRVCELKATLEREAFGDGFNILTLIEWGNAGDRGELEFNQSAIADAIRNYNTSIQQVLTTEQYQQWQRNGEGDR